MIPFEDSIDYQQEMQILNRKEYPAKNRFENNKQLNIIARAILIQPEIVEFWKQIGYYDICRDVNNLVLQGSLLILFHPDVKIEKVHTNDFVKCLQRFINIGFKLTKSVMTDILTLYEQHLDKIGNTFLEAFQIIRKSNLKLLDVVCCRSY